MILGFSRTWVAVAGITLVSLAAATAYRFGDNRRPERNVARLIRQAFLNAPPAEGRLIGFPFVENNGAEPDSGSLNQAQSLLLRVAPDSPERNSLQAYLDLAQGQWDIAAKRMERHERGRPNDLRPINDLGVIYLELGQRDVGYMYEAVAQFRKATVLDPTAVEPRFNLVLAYSELGLSNAADEALELYRALDPEPASVSYLVERPNTDRVSETPALRQALSGTDLEAAIRLASQQPGSFWEVILDVGLEPLEHTIEDYPLIVAVADRLSARLNDNTPRAMLAPLVSVHRERVVAARTLVQRAISEYERLNLEESLRLLTLATDSLPPELTFDHHWIELNRAAALTWTRDQSEARSTLETLVDGAKSEDLRWLMARALTVWGADPNLSDGHVKTIERLEEAIGLYAEVGALHDSSRARYYLATFLLNEGSTARSLTLASQALKLVDQQDSLRRQQLHWIIGLTLELRRAVEPAVLHNLEALRHANPADSIGPAHINAELAELFAQTSQPELADHHIRLAIEALGDSQAGNLMTTAASVAVRLAEARIINGKAQPQGAAALLREGLDLLENEGIDSVYTHQYRTELGKAHTLLGEVDEAREQFRLAVTAIEREDSRLDAVARLAFDERRRAVYEAAIRFELDQGKTETAWSYAQQYRAKLLSETVDQYAVDGEVFPKAALVTGSGDDDLEEGRVLEFTLMEDRLVLWVLSEDGPVQARLHEVDRDELQAEVARFIQLLGDISEDEELDRLSESLYGSLIAPVRDLLEGAAWLTIVPDRMLHRLPFAALPAPDGSYLLENHTFTQAPHIAYFLNPPDEVRAEPKLVSFGSHDQSAAVRNELDGVNNVYRGVSSLNGPAVTKERFLEGMKDATLFHFAGHSAVDGTNSLSSTILLDGVENGPNAVSALEIADSRLATNALVVLSSCDSSVGNFVGGVEYRGLTSAFLIAGAGAVVGSLWPVETTATARLMVLFHQNVAAGRSIAEALRLAQLALLEEESHPYFWSGFTVTGNRSALESPPFL